MPAISLKCTSLEKSFLNKIIFRNVNLELMSGDSIAITGKNGSGKSTLLKVLANLIKPNKGKVEILDNGTEVVPDKVHMHLGMIAPYINLYDELSAYENLDFFFDLKCKSDKYPDKKERIKYLLDENNVPAPDKKGINAVFIEDEIENFELLNMLLRQHMNLVNYTSSVDAVEKIKENKFDVIFMDIGLKEINGMEATKLIRQMDEYKNTPIIAITAFAMAGDKERILASGCDEYISKPFTREYLFSVLERLKIL